MLTNGAFDRQCDLCLPDALLEQWTLRGGNTVLSLIVTFLHGNKQNNKSLLAMDVTF